MCWAEVSEAIATSGQLHEDSHEFRDWKLAGLVASKVYYHLGECSKGQKEVRKYLEHSTWIITTWMPV